MYTNIYIYVYLHLCIYMYIHIYIYIYVHIFTPINIYIHVYIYLFTYTCSCTHIYVHVYVYNHKYVYIYIFMCLCIYMYIHIHKHMFIQHQAATGQQTAWPQAGPHESNDMAVSRYRWNSEEEVLGAEDDEMEEQDCIKDGVDMRLSAALKKEVMRTEVCV